MDPHCCSVKAETFKTEYCLSFKHWCKLLLEHILRKHFYLCCPNTEMHRYDGRLIYNARVCGCWNVIWRLTDTWYFYGFCRPVGNTDNHWLVDRKYRVCLNVLANAVKGSCGSTQIYLPSPIISHTHTHSDGHHLYLTEGRNQQWITWIYSNITTFTHTLFLGVWVTNTLLKHTLTPVARIPTLFLFDVCFPPLFCTSWIFIYNTV